MCAEADFLGAARPCRLADENLLFYVTAGLAYLRLA